MSKQLPSEHNFGLYLHIPFCVQKCPYCSFFSLAGKSDAYDRYARAVNKQLQVFSELPWSRSGIVDTIFFGGGTPSVLPAALLAEILAECFENFMVADEPEISIEVNPATVSRGGLQELFEAGFNRVSIGAQSLTDHDLELLGRPHNSADVNETVGMARKAGFVNLSLDLMYGLPGQTVSGWHQVLKKALRLEPDHLSIYELTIEPGTVFAELQGEGKLNLPEEDQVLEMMELTMKKVTERGFHRYEISNYALPGKECYHNIHYWQNDSYIGAGAGAVSCLSGCRKRAVEDIETYCRNIEESREPWIESEELEDEERFRETVIMGLRMIRGVSLPELQKRFDMDLLTYYGSALDLLLDEGLVVQENDRIFLSPKGLPVANRVMAELV